MKKEPLGKMERGGIFTLKTRRVMKMCGIFCLALTMSVSAKVYSQQNEVSLNLKDVTLEEFIEEVKQQTGVHFLYNASLFEGADRVTVKARKEPLAEVLEEILGQKGYAIDYRDEVVVIVKQAPELFVPQVNKRTVSGTVKDEKGQPLPGVSVVLKGTTTGVATDINGNYRLLIPAGEHHTRSKQPQYRCRVRLANASLPKKCGHIHHVLPKWHHCDLRPT